MGLTKTQRAFLQGMMSARVLSERRTAMLYSRCAVEAAKSIGKEPSASATAVPDEEALDNRIGDINEVLEKLHIQLRKGFSPADDGTFWGVVNTIADESSKLASEFSAPQVALFQAIVQALLDDDQARMPLADATALGLALERNLTMKVSEASKAIQALHKARWLRQVKPGAGGGGVTVTFGRAGFCAACKERCHGDHEDDVFGIYSKRAFRCDCGTARMANRCALAGSPVAARERRKLINTPNAYGHNYSDRYCRVPVVVRRGELGRLPTGNFEFSCHECTARLPFLADYYRIRGQVLPHTVVGEDIATAHQKLVGGGCSRPAPSSVSAMFVKSGMDFFWASGWRYDLCDCAMCLAIDDEDVALFEAILADADTGAGPIDTDELARVYGQVKRESLALLRRK
ncbi:hypothetical protein I4F81_012722 [Pyropia yezoensis]|uniref:Uncharacterized protein n=1 Tax=Pyropia yezoensis TaxID=2788 RepID=A0ACC3CJU2_PYRYE|nr:hypothetical protein I4F81_012722 [Neopyropia yezoensis]